MEKLGINLAWFLTQLVNVILILVILRQLAFKPVFQMLESRKRRIQESLDYAEKIKQESAQQQQDFERRLAEARQEAAKASESAQAAAQKERETILAQARVEARQIVDQAKQQIEYERSQMLAEVREHVVSLSMLATQKVVGQVIDETRQRQLIDEFLTTMPEASTNGH